MHGAGRFCRERDAGGRVVGRSSGEPARRPPNVRGTTFGVAVVPLVRRKSTVSLVPFQSGPTSGLLLEFISDDPLVEA